MATTKTVRSFFPGCRVEAVYSIEEALEWAVKQDWHVILLDESVLTPRPGEAIGEIRRRTPRAAIIIVAGHQNTAAALEFMQYHADYCLFRQTSAFLTELPLVIREILEKHDLKSRLDLSQERYLRLIENLVDMVYELDAEGRFLYISQAVQGLLHYEPQELIGQHYTVLIAHDHLRRAERRFNERRSEARATKKFTLQLKDKNRAALPQEVEINASGLYDRQRRFKGTVGVVRSTDGPVSALQQLADLPEPLSQILSTAQRVLLLVQRLRQQSEAPLLSTAPPPSAVQSERTDEKERPGDVPQKDRSASSITEHRRFPRIETELEGRLTSDDMTLEVSVLNIGVGGLYLVAKGNASVRVGQAAILGLTSEIGVLEIPGTVRSRRHAGNEAGAGGRTPLTGIAIEFVHRDEIESRILQSLIEGLRARSLIVRISVLLVSEKPSRTLCTEHDFEGPRGRLMKEERGTGPLHDRRQASRVRLDVAAHLEFVPDLPAPPHDSWLMNIGTGGACLRMQGPANLIGRHCSATFDMPSSPGLAYGAPAEQRVRGEVLWVEPDADSPTTDPGWVRLGVRFTDELVRGGAAALISRYLTAREPAASGGIVSELLDCRNARGQRLALCYDHPVQPHPPGSPMVIVAPGYGQTKRDCIPLGYYFVAHGFSVVRYDHSNHIGESDGGMVSTTLSAMKNDLGSVIQYAAERWPASPLVVVAPDLTGRAALRLFTHPMPVKLLLLLAPVVDVQSTLFAVHHEDLIGGALQGNKRGISNVLGFNIDADEWVNDAMLERYADLQSSQDDAAAIRTPTMVVFAQDDTWTRQHDVTHVKEALGTQAVDWLILPTGIRRVYENPARGSKVLAQVVVRCRSRLFPADRRTEVVMPSEDTIEREARLELERLRMHQQKARGNHIEFWRDYLDRSHYLVNFSDYWHLLDQIYRLLGPLPDSARVLDAGCGNGNLGMFLLIAQSLRQDQEAAKGLHYIGLDFVLSGLTQAKVHLLRVAAELRGKFSSIVRPHTAMAAGLACADLNLRLPFHDNQFDRVVCNLVLGYLRDPLFTLRELIRVLAPHGKLVLVNFKPHADLSQVYRNFAMDSWNSGELEKAKQMLDASGQLAECAGQGGFRSFDRQELAMLLMTSGASQPRVYSTFANQAYLAVAEKSR